MLDEELLYLYLVAENQWAIDCLYNRYISILNAMSKKIFNKFYTIPLEWNDLQSDIYFIFCDSVCNFKSVKNKSFRNYLLMNLNWGVLKYVKKYLSKNHQVVNLAVQYEDYLIHNYSQIDNYHADLTSYNLNLSLYERNVLQLKHQGFSNNEIMEKLNLSYKQVDNAYQRVCLKLKLLQKQ